MTSSTPVLIFLSSYQSTSSKNLWTVSILNIAIAQLFQKFKYDLWTMWKEYFRNLLKLMWHGLTHSRKLYEYGFASTQLIIQFEIFRTVYIKIARMFFLAHQTFNNNTYFVQLGIIFKRKMKLFYLALKTITCWLNTSRDVNEVVWCMKIKVFTEEA